MVQKEEKARTLIWLDHTKSCKQINMVYVLELPPDGDTIFFGLLCHSQGKLTYPIIGPRKRSSNHMDQILEQS